MHTFRLLLFLNFCVVTSFAQSQTTTANDVVPPSQDYFRYGVNPGYYPSWGNLDTTLANIAAGNIAQGIPGAGIKAFRPSLPESFVNFWGYDIRVFAFEHYKSIGMDNHCAFLLDADPAHLDPTAYCATAPTILWDNMYLDIWDNGANGTPVNDDNHFALYVYNTVQTYKEYVGYWEILNEPDLTAALHATAAPGTPGNWFENDPDPCDMAMKAPIQRYIRLLRIAYEVIKSLDADAYITTGGIGYPSFLHAILRNTDNPNGGTVTAEYPLTGGAYFDCLSYHVYPHIDGCYRVGWNNDIMDFDYQRHSDAGADCLISNKIEYEAVFDEFGYDGATYPKKRFIITEANVPRAGVVPNESNYGNDEIQRNWVVKAFIQSQKNEIDQLHLFRLGETADLSAATYEFELMGLYKNLNGSSPYTQEYTDEGIATRTLSEFLFAWSYDAAKTAAMNIPDGVEGGAFKNETGDYKYVLWARTMTDKSEQATANYSFPTSFGIDALEKTNWSASVNGFSETINSDNIQLAGEPYFLKPLTSTDCTLTVDIVGDTTICEGATTNLSAGNGFTSYLWSTGSTSASLTVSQAGTYSLTVSDGTACTAVNSVNVSLVSLAPVQIITSNPAPCVLQTVELSTNTTYANYLWSTQSTSPTISIEEDGIYSLTVTDSNACTSSNTIEVVFNVPDDTYLGVFICEGDFYESNGESYAETGLYTELYTAASGCDSLVYIDLIVLETPATSEIVTICSGDTYDGTVYTNSTSFTDSYQSQMGCDSIHTIQLNVLDVLETSETVQLCSGESYNGVPYTSSTLITEPFITAEGCEGIQTTTILVQDLIQLTETIQLCFGENYNGIPQFESQTISNLLVSDSACDTMETVEIMLNPALTLSFTTTSGCTAENQIEALVAGGSGNYNYLWNTGETTPIINSNLTGMYAVTVTDAANCTIIEEIMVDFPIAYTLTVDTTICAGSSIEFEGTSYTNTGLYTALYTAENGCDSLIQLDLTVQDEIILTDERTVCYGETINGLVLTESQLMTTVFPSVTGCDTLSVLDITVLSELEVALDTAVDCEGTGTIMAEAMGSAGNYTYLWNTNATVAELTDQVSGLYFLTVTDESGCTTESSIALQTNAVLMASINPIDVLCAGEATGSLNISVSGGVKPYLFDVINAFSTLEAGTYSVLIEDAVGCTLSETVTISEPLPLDANITTEAAVNGINGTAEVLVSGGVTPYAYLWSNGLSQQTITGLDAGIYGLTITDANNCTLIESVEITSSTNTIAIGQTNWRIYPNPATERVFFELTSEANQTVHLELYNTIGQRLRTRSYEGNMIQNSISIADLVAGIYLCKVQIGEQVYFEKLLKE